MTQSTAERNPFMLMISPEVVLAAMEKSEHLGRLNRHMCRPLDRVTPATLQAADAANDGDGDGDEADADAAADAEVDADANVDIGTDGSIEPVTA